MLVFLNPSSLVERSLKEKDVFDFKLPPVNRSGENSACGGLAFGRM